MRGTVTVTQDGTNIVDVDVSLNNLFFHDQGLESFAFNIFGSTTALQNPALTLVTGTLAAGDIKITNNGGTTWTLAQPAGNTDGAGKTFGYSLDCAGGSGACTGDPVTLEFQVDVTGLTPAAFETTTGSTTGPIVDFAANVANGTCTGMIGAGSGTSQSTPSTTGSKSNACTSSSTVPEPTSLLLLGTVLAVAGKFLKARLAV